MRYLIPGKKDFATVTNAVDLEYVVVHTYTTHSIFTLVIQTRITISVRCESAIEC